MKEHTCFNSVSSSLRKHFSVCSIIIMKVYPVNKRSSMGLTTSLKSLNKTVVL